MPLCAYMSKGAANGDTKSLCSLNPILFLNFNDCWTTSLTFHALCARRILNVKQVTVCCLQIFKASLLWNFLFTAFQNKSFMEFLHSKKLSKKVQHFILHSIAMVTDEASTLEGLEATRKFLHSLGRYGNSAFLWPMYGVGELPQAFSRSTVVLST